MTAHGMMFDLRLISRIVALVEPPTDPHLQELTEEIKSRARVIFGSVGQDDIRPPSESDFAELKTRLKLSTDELIELQWQVCLDVLQFITSATKYFTALRSIRAFTADEQAVGPEIEQLVDNVMDRFSSMRRSGKTDPTA